ncbi:hypothetical protein CYY_008201 [Polysphondylium violaceum]|uniref:Carboxypeptidase n=1 Tax=Polysphondylium violaceum TaxID=133409 RepID=A0A8J4PPM0_9MYCE|nr:hypothetical protein CYY_008201 [Polysphondylium violaceum]
MNKFIILCITLCVVGTLVESKLNFGSRSETDFKKPNPKPVFGSAEYYDSNYLKPLEAITETPNDYLVASLPGLKDIFPMYAGLITVNETSGGNIFFWFFPANVTTPTDAPLLVWINGGPGCSSLDGVFLENGPLRVNQDMSISINPYSWHQSANVLYIDQPVGTGLSYTLDDSGLATNDLELEQNFYQFIQYFLTIFSNYKSNPFFMSGESYAGHYIPHYANYIVTMNKNSNNNTFPINIQGLAIGNGWTHPIVQYESYGPFAYAAGIISIEQANAYTNLVTACQSQINAGNFMSDECDNVMGTLQSDSGSNTTSMVNVYDIRLYDPTGGVNWPEPGITYESDYLNRADVRQAIHASSVPHNWTECNNTVYQYLSNQDESSLFLFPSLLEQMRILVYNGQFDLICNHVGTTEYLDVLEWSGAEEWKNSSRYIWTSYAEDGSGDLVTGGYSRSVQNLTYLLVLGGSHMVPYDMPVSTQDMITRFLKNKDFKDIIQSQGAQIQPTPTPTPQTKNPLPIGAWIGITVGGCVFGILVGTVITYVFMRSKMRNPYTSLN